MPNDGTLHQAANPALDELIRLTDAYPDAWQYGRLTGRLSGDTVTIFDLGQDGVPAFQIRFEATPYRLETVSVGPALPVPEGLYEALRDFVPLPPRYAVYHGTGFYVTNTGEGLVVRDRHQADYKPDNPLEESDFWRRIGQEVLRPTVQGHLEAGMVWRPSALTHGLVDGFDHHLMTTPALRSPLALTCSEPPFGGLPTITANVLWMFRRSNHVTAQSIDDLFLSREEAVSYLVRKDLKVDLFAGPPLGVAGTGYEPRPVGFDDVDRLVSRTRPAYLVEAEVRLPHDGQSRLVLLVGRYGPDFVVYLPGYRQPVLQLWTPAYLDSVLAYEAGLMAVGLPV